MKIKDFMLSIVNSECSIYSKALSYFDTDEEINVIELKKGERYIIEQGEKYAILGAYETITTQHYGFTTKDEAKYSFAELLRYITELVENEDIDEVDMDLRCIDWVGNNDKYIYYNITDWFFYIHNREDNLYLVMEVGEKESW